MMVLALEKALPQKTIHYQQWSECYCSAVASVNCGRQKCCGFLTNEGIANESRARAELDIFPQVTAQRVRLNPLSTPAEAHIREFQLFNGAGEP